MSTDEKNKVESVANQINGRWECFGKWIYCGEHTVLRGGTALAFPLRSRSLILSFESHSQELDAHFMGEHGPEVKIIFWMVVDKALAVLGKSRSQVTGTVTISNNIPIGAGLGASAALCVAVTYWLKKAFSIVDLDVVEFARNLENLFHGESSGVDVMVAANGRGVQFVRGQEPVFIDWKKHPGFLAISHCGKPGVTLDAVTKVKNIFVTNLALAESLDQKMSEAVEKGLRSLVSGQKEDVIDCMQLASECFQQWGLADGPVGDHQKALQLSGAIATKPTGSGGGGFVLSFWEKAPSPEIIQKFQLLPCFERQAE